MPDGPAPAAKPSRNKPRKFKWRPWLRALHRDFGYVAVGLTLIYALSGLAVNHIADWNSNFIEFEQQFQVEGQLPEDPADAAPVVLAQAGIEEEPLDVYESEENQFIIDLENSSLFVSTDTGNVLQQGQKDRAFFRAANWLHLNRGKKAWTYFADGYAVVLLFLALSGLFMIPGKKGLLGRGAVLVTAGIAIPLVYLTFIGSP
jgi:hypothetical protein